MLLNLLIGIFFMPTVHARFCQAKQLHEHRMPSTSSPSDVARQKCLHPWCEYLEHAEMDFSGYCGGKCRYHHGKLIAGEVKKRKSHKHGPKCKHEAAGSEKQTAEHEPVAFVGGGTSAHVPQAGGGRAQLGIMFRCYLILK